MSSRVGLFGKLPTTGDFIQRGPVSAAVAGFRSWLEQGVERAALRKSDPLRAALDDARVFAFVFRRDGSELVVGALKPSVDAASRRFPVSVYMPLDAVHVCAAPHLLPLGLGEFVQDAADALLSDDVVVATERLDHGYASAPFAPAPFSEQALEYDGWAASTAIRSVFEAVFSESSGPASAAVHTIREVIAPFYGKDAPPTPLSVRVPLGHAGTGALAFWIDVVRHAAGWQRTVPTVFWSNDESGGDALIQLGDTPPGSLSELWAPDPGSDHVCDLRHAIDVRSFLHPPPQNLLAMIGDPTAKVSEFMRVLHHRSDNWRSTP
jgi:type VI secretion system ImpM family protein